MLPLGRVRLLILRQNPANSHRCKFLWSAEPTSQEAHAYVIGPLDIEKHPLHPV